MKTGVLINVSVICAIACIVFAKFALAGEYKPWPQQTPNPPKFTCKSIKKSRHAPRNVDEVHPADIGVVMSLGKSAEKRANKTAIDKIDLLSVILTN